MHKNDRYSMCHWERRASHSSATPVMANNDVTGVNRSPDPELSELVLASAITYHVGEIWQL
jgi:hypothetical protein